MDKNLVTMNAMLTEQVERIAAESAIRNLIAKIFILTDTAPDLSEYRECFTDDALWERIGIGAAERIGAHLGAKATGRDGIVADRLAVRAAGATGPTADTWHMATNICVSVDSQDHATARTSWLFVLRDGDGYKIRSAGFYRDDFRRVDGDWKLAHRRYSMGKPPTEFAPPAKS